MSGTGRSGRWEFDEQGNCRFIPESEDGQTQNGQRTAGNVQQTYSTRQQWQRAVENAQRTGSNQQQGAAEHEWHTYSSGQRTSGAERSNQQSNYAQQQRQYANASGASRSQGDFWQWALIIGLFVIGGWPIAVILLILKAKGIWGGGKSAHTAGTESWQNTARHVDEHITAAGAEMRQGLDKARQAVQSGVQTARENTRAAQQKNRSTYEVNTGYANRQKQTAAGKEASRAEGDRQKKRAWREWAKAHGLGHIGLLRTIGAVITGTFGLSLLLALTSGEADLTMAMVFLSFLAGGISLLGLAGSRSGKLRRYQRYLAMIGSQDEISIAAVAKTLGFREKRVMKDFQDMLDCGVFERGYLDAERKLLILREWSPAAQPEPEETGTDAETNASVAALRRIRDINNNIADPEMSAKIDQIEALTAKILRLLEENPEKADELRSFLNYYLPETMHILDRYSRLEAQGVDRGNIAAAKQQIEETTDKLVTAYETQLDKLFESDVLDISADLKVMETMLEKDGLTDNGLHL